MIQEILRRLDAAILSAHSDWEASKPVSRLSNSRGRQNGDGFFLGTGGGLREARIIVLAVARELTEREPRAAGRLLSRRPKH